MFTRSSWNPNVIDIVSYINSVLQPTNIFSCTYDNIENKITFTRLTPQTPTNNIFYNNTLKAGNFLGFNNDTKVLISFGGTTSTNPINVNTVTALSVGIDGDISFNHNNMESNLNKML